MEGPIRIRIQPLAPCGTTQNLNPVSESGVQSCLNSDSLVLCSLPWPALTLIKLHTVDDCSTFQLTKIFLRGPPFSKGVNRSSQFSVICKLTFKFWIQVIYAHFCNSFWGSNWGQTIRAILGKTWATLLQWLQIIPLFFSTIPISLRTFKCQSWMASVVEDLKRSVSEIIWKTDVTFCP